MFRCCQTPIQHGNELVLEPIQFPHDIASRRGKPTSTAHWRQITGVAASTQSPRAALPSPARSSHAVELGLLPVGSISAASPRKSGSRRSKSHRSHRQTDEPQQSPTSSLPTPTDNPIRLDSSLDSPSASAEISAVTLPVTVRPDTTHHTSTSDHSQLREPEKFEANEVPPPPPPPINILPAPESFADVVEVQSLSDHSPTSSPAVTHTSSQSSTSIAPSSSVAGSREPSPLPLRTSAAAPRVSPGARSTGDASGTGTSTSVAANPFKLRESAPVSPTPKSRLSTGKAPPPSARAAGSPGGLRTKDRSKMVDLLDAKVKKSVYTACNFVRETIETDPADKAEVCDREAAFTLWTLIFASQLEAAGKQHPVATACAHIMDCAQGELATNQARKAAPMVQFFVKAIVRPTLENLMTPDAKHDSIYVAKDIRDTARVTLGEKPPGLAQRTPYLESFLTKCNYPKLKSLSEGDKEELFQTLVGGMDESRRGGDAYKNAVKKVQDVLYS